MIKTKVITTDESRSIFVNRLNRAIEELEGCNMHIKDIKFSTSTADDGFELTLVYSALIIYETN